MAKVKQSLVLVFVLIYSVADGLICNYCVSSSSFDECISNQDAYCPPGFNRCFKGEISYSIDAKQVTKYGKGCTTVKQCSDGEDETCKNLKDFGIADVTCTMACCSGDNCNAGTGIQVSVILILPCSMFVLAFMYK